MLVLSASQRSALFPWAPLLLLLLMPLLLPSDLKVLADAAVAFYITSAATVWKQVCLMILGFRLHLLLVSSYFSFSTSLLLLFLLSLALLLFLLGGRRSDLISDRAGFHLLSFTSRIQSIMLQDRQKGGGVGVIGDARVSFKGSKSEGHALLTEAVLVTQ